MCCEGANGVSKRPISRPLSRFSRSIGHVVGLPSPCASIGQWSRPLLNSLGGLAEHGGDNALTCWGLLRA
jgi:hypothetical protein